MLSILYNALQFQISVIHAINIIRSLIAYVKSELQRIIMLHLIPHLIEPSSAYLRHVRDHVRIVGHGSQSWKVKNPRKNLSYLRKVRSKVLTNVHCVITRSIIIMIR